jgi:hypothetical protein
MTNKGPRPISTEDIWKMLRADKNFEIIDRSTAEVPQVDIDYSAFETGGGFDAEARQVLEELVEKCKLFLRRPIIKDTFEVHTKRREWRMSMSAKYGDAFNAISESNALRINNLIGIGSLVYSLSVFLRPRKRHGTSADTASEKIKEYTLLAPTFPNFEDYDDHTTEEKVKLVQEVDDFCRAFLKIVSK